MDDDQLERNEHKSDVEEEIHDLNADVEHIDAEDERLARAVWWFVMYRED